MQTVKLQELSLPDQPVVLDLGCGEGRHAIECFNHLKAAIIVGVDLSHQDLKTASQRLDQNKALLDRKTPCSFITTDGLKLPFTSQSFDLVICSEVLEHVPDYESMLDEIFRVLKPEAQLAVSVPRAWPEQICWFFSKAYHSNEGGHIRIFRAKQLKKKILSKPYQFQKKYYAHALHTPYWWMRCLKWNNGRDNAVSKLYHRLLVWDLMKKPWLTQTIEKYLNPLMGKSIVLHFKKIQG